MLRHVKALLAWCQRYHATCFLAGNCLPRHIGLIQGYSSLRPEEQKIIAKFVPKADAPWHQRPWRSKNCTQMDPNGSKWSSPAPISCLFRVRGMAETASGRGRRTRFQAGHAEPLGRHVAIENPC